MQAVTDEVKLMLDPNADPYAAPVSDATWLVTTANRVLRQNPSVDDGIHIRNRLAIPFATTSAKWTHFLLIPDGNRLKIRAINLSQ